jgi:myo-inositol catabolism protein IolH
MVKSANGLRVAADTSILRKVDAPRALAQLCALGYDHVEVGLAHYFAQEATDEDTASLRSELERQGVGLAALAGIYPASYPEEELRAVGVQNYAKAAGRARELGSGLVVSELMGDAERYPECSAAFVKSMREIIPTLEKEKVVLCFEAHPGDFTERNKIAVDLIRGLETPWVKYLYCVPHSFVLGEDVMGMIEYAKDVLGYVHFADTLRPERTFFSGRYSPKVPPHQHLTPGMGDVELSKVVAALKRIGYEGFVTVNPFSMFDEPLMAMAKGKAKLDELLSEG